MAEDTRNDVDFEAAEAAILADLAESGGVAETQTESERTRFVDPLQSMKAIELARKLDGRVAPRVKSPKGTTYAVFRSRRRGW